MSIRKHAVYNMAGAVLPAMLSLFIVPVYLGLIGDARYGLLAIVWLLVGYLGLFDFGLSAATAQRIAALTRANAKQQADVFFTALLMNGGLGVMGGLVIWPLADFLLGRTTIANDALRQELQICIPLLMLAVPLITLSGVLTGALQGSSHFRELNIISTIGSCLIQLVPLPVIWLYGTGLVWLILSVICVRVVILGVLFWRCWAHVFRGFRGSVSPDEAKRMLKFGGWVTMSSLISPLMIVLDRFVIGVGLGPAATTYYTVPFQLAERTTMLPAALTTALFPRLAASDAVEGQRLAVKAIQSLVWIFTPCMAVAVLLMDPFLRWWLSTEFANTAGLPGRILILGFWINALARVPYVLLQAKGRPDLVAKCHALELIPYLIMLFLGLEFWGLLGAALMFGVRAAADCALLMYLAGIWKDVSRMLLTPMVVLGVAFMLSTLVFHTHFVWMTAAYLGALAAWIFYKNSSLLSYIKLNVLKIWNSKGDR